MNISGKIHKIFPEERKSDKFTMRNFVLDTGARYGNLVIFQLTNDKCDLADKVSPGDNVDVSFDIVSNESRDRFFVNLNAYKIELTR